MAHRQHRAAEPRHEPLQQLTAGEVEMRLRLVEEQQLGVLDEATDETDELALPARSTLRRQVELPLLEPDAQQQDRARPSNAGPPLRS